MPHPAKLVFAEEMARARAAHALRRHDQAVHHLERAHIVGQRYFLAHLLSHWWMLRIAAQRNDVREVAGQLARIVAVLPGYVSGWVPTGNPGGAKVPAFRSMPIAPDLHACFQGYSRTRQIGWRLAALALAAVACVMVDACRT